MPVLSILRDSQHKWIGAVATLLGAATLALVVERLARQRRRSKAGRVTDLHRFAVKGLERDVLESCYLAKGDCFPSDRKWGLLRQEELQEFVPEETKWIHKMKFFAACSEGEALARFTTTYTDETSTLTVLDKKSQELLLQARLCDEAGRKEVESFFSRVFGDGNVAFISADKEPTQFCNTRAGLLANGDCRTVHLVNRATVRKLEEAAGTTVGPLRFRANILFDDVAPWQEFQWVGRKIAIGQEVQMKVVKRTVRCAATCIDLDSASRDVDAPALLQQYFPEHGPYLGVYAQVVRGGTIRPGDSIHCL